MLFVLFIYTVTAHALEVPAYKGYVNDYAGILSASAENQLNAALLQFDTSDSTQVAVLTIPTLDGEVLEEFSIRAVDSWGMGQKGKDNGVLLLIVQKERKVRIEVGRGLEGVLTDLLAGRIIDQVIIPYFKSGQFDKGAIAGVNAIIGASRGEFKAEKRSRGQRKGSEPPPIFSYLLIASIFTAYIGGAKRIVGVISGALLLPVVTFAGLGPSVGWLILLMLIPAGALGGFLLPLLLAGAVSSGSSHRGSYYGGYGGLGGGMGRGGGFGGGGFGGGGASGGW